MITNHSYIFRKILIRMAIILAGITSHQSYAQWQVWNINDDIDEMRFNTVNEAHGFVGTHFTNQESGEGILLGSSTTYNSVRDDGSVWSRHCFKPAGVELDPDLELDIVRCTANKPSGLYLLSSQIILREMEDSVFLVRDLGEPTTEMCVGNPINLATGNKFQKQEDYISGGVEPLEFSRFYNSQSHSDVMGGWSHTFSSSIKIDPEEYGDNMVALYRAEGAQLAFYSADDHWIPAWKTSAKLEETSQGWTYTLEDGVVETYDINGRLISVSYPSGNVHSLTYDGDIIESISDGFGKTLSLVYTGDQIVGVIDPAGEMISYVYNAEGLLSDVVYQDGSSKSYLYDDPQAPGLLSGIIDEEGARFATWEYDVEGRAVSSTHDDGVDQTTITYHGDGIVDVTNALGHIQTYAFSRRNGLFKVDSIEGAPCSGFIGGIEYREYDNNGLLSSVTDNAGQERRVSYNDRGLEISRRDSDGGIVKTTWHSEYALPISITEPELVTSFVYDDQLRLLSKTLKDRSTNESRTWTYTYSSTALGTPSLVSSIDGPRTDIADVTTLEYDGYGNVVTQTNALGHITHYMDYDAHGRPGKMIDANGVSVSFIYDLRGRLISSTSPVGTTNYVYDGRGLLIEIENPAGAVISYEYDAAQRLVSATDALGNTRTDKLDALGNPTHQKIIDVAGSITWSKRNTYNQIGWLTETQDAYGNKTNYGYDVVSNLVETVDPAGDRYGFDYDGYHHRTRITDPYGETTQIVYEDTGDVRSVSDPRSRRTYYSYNGFGEVVEIRSPDTGTTRISYDSAGNISTRTDEKGQVHTYTYDALNRPTLVSSNVSGELPLQYFYDEPGSSFGIGQLTSVDDGSGVRIYNYTAEGQLASENWTHQGSLLSTSYEYDDSGNLVKITYPSGRIVSYERDLVGNIISVTTSADDAHTPVASSIGYAPFGLITSIEHGNGIQEARTFDLNYRAESITVQGIHSLDYSYTTDSNISAIVSSVLPETSKSMEYDAIDRLVYAEGNFGAVDYIYDENGNRTSTFENNVETENRIHYANNWLLESGATDYTYDDNGNLVERGNDTFIYDSRNRIITSSVSEPANYLYNYLNQRVVKEISDTKVLYIYDQNGNLISEIDATTGAVNAEYIWVDQLPLAFIQFGDMYHIHSDHLLTPKALSDAEGKLAWKAEYKPFGEAEVYTTGIEFNLRFPGQYYDAESGLHYNWNRTYDPALGRYLQSDPIGLNGGLNTYTYVNGNPISAIDPEGLFTVPLLVLHWSRNYWNENVQNIEDVSRWTELSPAESVFHQMGPGNRDNRKFVSPNGRSEAVFSCNDELVTDPANYGTFNYFGPRFMGGLPHVIFDVAPYFILGNSHSDMLNTQRFEAVYENYIR